MGYAIICDARSGKRYGIDTLALVDRSKTKKRWWTSDCPELIMKFRKKSAADYSAKRMRKNNARVVAFDEAYEIITTQDETIGIHEANMENEAGWDGHKNN